MDLFSMFKGGKYFNKHIEPKCDYCQFGKRAKDGNKVLCEKRGLVDCSYSCNKFIYSPLKRIPVKQLNFVGSLADEDIYIESAGDRAEKEEQEASEKKTASGKKAPEKKQDNGSKPAAEEKKSAEEKSAAENKPAESKPTETKPAENTPADNAPVEKALAEGGNNSNASAVQNAKSELEALAAQVAMAAEKEKTE